MVALTRAAVRNLHPVGTPGGSSVRAKPVLEVRYGLAAHAVNGDTRRVGHGDLADEIPTDDHRGSPGNGAVRQIVRGADVVRVALGVDFASELLERTGNAAGQVILRKVELVQLRQLANQAWNAPGQAIELEIQRLEVAQFVEPGRYGSLQARRVVHWQVQKVNLDVVAEIEGGERGQPAERVRYTATEAVDVQLQRGQHLEIAERLRDRPG